MNDFRRYRPDMLLVDSCSRAAISAACYASREDVDAATLPVLWGAVGNPPGDGHGRDIAVFTSLEASPPVR